MPNPKNDAQRLDQQLKEVAEQVGGTLHVYPRPGVPVRQAVLRDYRDERGTQYEEAFIEDDGTLRITGIDQGSHVSDF